MKVKLFGAFRELAHGDPNGPSLLECINQKPHEDEAKIIRYLNDGVVWITCGGLTRDVLDEAGTIIGCPNMLTDGVWVWYADLAYYIQKYHARLPDEVLEHMRLSNWKIQKSVIDVSNLEL